MPIVTDILDWKIFPVGVGFLISTFIINNIIPLLPVSGFAFLSLSVLFWFVSLCLTFFYLHKLLQRKVPLIFIKPITHLKKHRGDIKPDPEKLKGFTNDIDNYFVSKWYVFISHDEEFTEETGLFLEDVIKRIAEIQSCVNNKALAHGILNIYLRHLKEYRRSIKRQEKYNGSIEEMYSFPTELQARNIWLSLIGLEETEGFKKRTVLCSDHFDAADILIKVNGVRYLKPGAMSKLQHSLFPSSSFSSDSEDIFDSPTKKQDVASAGATVRKSLFTDDRCIEPLINYQTQHEDKEHNETFAEAPKNEAPALELELTSIAGPSGLLYSSSETLTASEAEHGIKSDTASWRKPESKFRAKRYSHIVSVNPKVKNYFIHQLTSITMKHFINSELWNSLPCHVLVSIIARKFVLFILTFISQPEVLNYHLLNTLATKEIKDKYNLSSYNRICVNQYYNVVDSMAQQTDIKEIEIPSEQKNKRTKTPTVQVEESIRIQQKPNTNEQEIKKPKNNISQYKKSKIVKQIDRAEEVKEEEQTLIIKSTVNAPVKIHEPKLTRSTKTYADTKDLAYGISLGQDPLDILPVRIENVRSTIEHVEDSANLLLSEVKLTTQSTMEGLKSSIKPISDATVHTLHNIKDLQETTMNNALHRIGDFQDEAAGMVGGILDFGRAGIRKGLRLTGLQDNIEQAKASLNISQSDKHTSKRKVSKISKTDSTDKSVVEEESVWMNPLQMESPNYDGQILLEKSFENLDREKRGLEIPSISMEEPSSGTNTPDIEYEETADLASSIAKLRSLLQQRSSESSMSTPALSPMPPDDLTQKPLEGETTMESDEVDGMIPSFYKFCAKTATGVFDKTIHSIKTALPTHVPGLEQSDNAWIFLQTDQTEVDILTRMKKLLNERKEYCTLDTEIDTAYEAIDSLDTFQQSLFSSSLEFEDELDEFDAKLPISKALIDIACELLSDTDTPFITEPVIKAILLIAGNAIENSLVDKIDQLIEELCTNLLKVPEVSNSNELYLGMDIFVQLILASIPDSVKVIFGKEVLQKVIRLFVSSLQIRKVNQDVVLQIFELVSLKLIEESSRPSPPASA